jgi:hypothetical protein
MYLKGLHERVSLAFQVSPAASIYESVLSASTEHARSGVLDNLCKLCTTLLCNIPLRLPLTVWELRLGLYVKRSLPLVAHISAMMQKAMCTQTAAGSFGIY